MVDGHWFDHQREALTDFVVAPYLRVLVLERLVGTNVECIPGMNLTEQRVEGCCNRR